MIRLTLFTLLACLVLTLEAQTTSTSQPSNTIYFEEQPTYHIYSTDLINNFIILDTRNGKIWLLQLNTKSKYRFTSPIIELS